jgi:PAS domain S-box-containing protein
MVEFQFASDFLIFVVGVAGLVLIVLSADLSDDAGRETMIIGFALTAAASFANGNHLFGRQQVLVVVAIRVCGIVAVAVGSLRWQRGCPRARRLLWAGLLALSIAAVSEVFGADRASGVALAVGGVLVLAALVAASPGSMGTRVAASAAGIMLLVVLLLSVSFSEVLSSSLQRSELARLHDQATTEVARLNSDAQANLALAKDAVLQLARPGTAHPVDVSTVLRPMQQANPLGGFEYVPATAGPGSSPGVLAFGLSDAVATSVARTQVSESMSCLSPGSQSIDLVGNQAYSVGAFPICDGQLQTLGTVVRARALDDAYLQGQRQDDSDFSLALVSAGTAVATAGQPPPNSVLGSAVWARDASLSAALDGRYVVLQRLPVTGNATVAVVVSSPTTVVAAARDQLFRLLFLIALGAILFAVGLAVVVGERITAVFRQLTLVAESIGRGERSRTGITGNDEIGQLGAAIDAMAGSIEEKTESLRSAADIESRLLSRLEAVVAAMSDALVAVDGNGTITDFNQAAEELVGARAAQVVGEPVDQAIHLMDESGVSLGPRLATPSPNRWSQLATAVDSDGTEFRVAVSGGPLRGPARELVGQVLLLRDLRRESELDRMKTELVSRMGHEMRTPLTPIIFYADLLLRHQFRPDEANEYHAVILSQAKRLRRVVEMLEFFASLGAGWVVFRPSVLDVRAVLDSVVAPWSEKLTGPNRITIEVDEAVTEVLADRRWLGVAIDELIDNAVKFSQDGTTDVTVKAVIDEGLEISVRDRGKGMTAGEQATAFDEFVQGDGSDSRQFGGLGLGLSLVQQVVKGHGGTVRCHSVPGRGSTLTIVLPLVDTPSAIRVRPR